MERRNLLSAIALIPALAWAQTYYYANSLSVQPAAPTDQDPITITVSGDLSATNAEILSTDHAAMGNTVQLTINATASGIGLDVLVPHDEQFELGTLPEGDYTIDLNGSATSDGAPEPQHHFTVSRSDQPACDSVIVLSVTWAPFSDTTLVVHVLNNSTNIFSYPGFIMYDQMGDTLAQESVFYFGIPQESWHMLTVKPGADLSTPSFVAGLELWTGFYTEQACAWNVAVELCPPPPCSIVLPSMVNTGGGLTEGTIPWSIIDAQNVQVASGTFDMNSLNQIDQDTVCLPPGSYTLQASHPGPLSGAPQMYMSDGNYLNDMPAQPFIANGQTNQYPFGLYLPCAGPMGIGESTAVLADVVNIENGRLQISDRLNGAIGLIRLVDASGRTLLTERSSGSHWSMDLAGTPSGIYLVRIETPAGEITNARVAWLR